MRAAHPSKPVDEYLHELQPEQIILETLISLISVPMMCNRVDQRHHAHHILCDVDNQTQKVRILWVDKPCKRSTDSTNCSELSTSPFPVTNCTSCATSSNASATLWYTT